jgi:DNA polymerase-3 subunit chi
VNELPGVSAEPTVRPAAGRIDFYVLKHADARARNVFACRLTEKAYLKDLKVLVLADDDAQARDFDALLWTFSDDSFVPHQIMSSPQTAPSPVPVRISSDPAHQWPADLVLNLGNHRPESLTRFPRIAEIIDNDENRKRLGRERFKFYRERQLTLETHQIPE